MNKKQKHISNRSRYYQGQERELNKEGRSLQSIHEWKFVDNIYYYMRTEEGNLYPPNIWGLYNNGAVCLKCNRIEWIGDVKMWAVINGEFPPKKGCIINKKEE